MKVSLVRYNEIALKGSNLSIFENLLIKNIKGCLAKNRVKFEKIRKSHKRILIYTDNDCGFLKYVFGIASFSSSVETDLDMDKIKEMSLDLLKNLKFEKFRVSAKRGNKNFSYNSLQVNNIIGELIKNKLSKKVDLEHFDLEVGIELL